MAGAVMTAPSPARRRADAPTPVSHPAPRTPPPLRVVRPAPRRRRARLLTVLVSIVVMASLFGLVASHVLLTQGQFRLDRLRSRAAAEQARYERLRLQVAELESPSRVVATAQERLGMVPPPTVTYLSPTGAVSASEEEREAGGNRSAAEDDEYARVKRSLAGRR
jgi:cell division protein FtsL